MTNTEPQGIKDIREAKADYLESLAKLRDADAEKVKAEATVEQAKAEVQKAIAAQNQALAEAQQILNEAARIDNEVAAAKAKAAIDTIKAKAELDAVKAQEALAKAQADLEKTLRDLAAAAIGLTGAEKDTLASKTLALNTAYYNYNAWLGAYNGAVKDLWNAEYNIVAGVKGYETAESYKDSIAAQNDKIAKANEVIASLEALKEHPQAVKDSIDAIDAQIADLWKQLNLINSDKILYEATPGFVESKAAFAKRVETFKKDSLGGTTFKFVDKDEDGNDIPVEYDLTDGKGIDEKFASIMNYSSWKYTSDDFCYLPEKGFEYNDENKAIEVGFAKFWVEDEQEGLVRIEIPATPEQLTDGLDVLDEIVETLNRELVVVDNLKDSTTIEEAKKAAHVADSVFDAHYAILKDGLEKYQPLIDSQAVVKAKGSDLTAAKEVLAQKVANFNADSNAVVTAIKGVSAELIDAAEEFAAATNNIRSSSKQFYSISKDDSARFIAAAVTLGKAKAKYFGVQDSIELIEVNLEGARKPYGVPFSELNASGFVQTVKVPNGESAKGTSLYGGTGYGAYKNSSFNELKGYAWYQVSQDGHLGHYVASNWDHDAFTKVVRTAGVSGYTWTKDISPKEVLYAGTYYKKESPVAYDMCSWTDTVKWYKNFVGTEAKAEKKGDFAKVVVKAAYDKMDASKVAVETAKEDTVKAYNAVEKAKKGVEKATIAYQTIYKSFWGITGNLDPDTKKECVKPQKFTWTKKTFLEPSNCVKFNYFEFEGELYGNIIKNTALETILDNVDLKGYADYSEYGFWHDVDNHRIFRNKDSRNLTEFAQALLKAKIVEDLGEYVPNKARLEKINAQVAQIREDVEAAIAKYEAATEGLEEVKARFYGVDEDGEINYKVEVLDERNVNVEKGKWAFGGYLLEWAEELAPEYPAIVKAVNDKTPAIFAEIFILENYKKTLDLIFTIYFDFFEAQKEGQMGGNVEGILYALNEAIKDQKNTVIAGCKVEIAKFEKLVAACEAGYSPADAVIASLKQTVETYKRYLAQAEEALARAQKEYDEAIAMYGVNE